MPLTRLPWLAPDATELRARRSPPGIPSVLDGVNLTPAQDSAMRAVHARFQPQFLAAMQSWRAAPSTDTAARAAAVRAIVAAEREATLRLLTPAQRATYRRNQQRITAALHHHDGASPVTSEGL
jgi:hypothetical protein